jgi:hypothetical protein
VLNNLKDLQINVEKTLMQGQKAFGKGIFHLFDFIKDSLPDKDVTNLKFYNRLSFAVFDKYLLLREVNREMNEQMS